MKFKDMIVMALGNLFKRKVRTLLTIMGVIIGTCSIVVMLSFGIGIKQSMEKMMQGMGDLTVITINNYSPAPDSPSLNDKMLKKLKSMKSIVTVTPVYNLDCSSISIKSRKYQYQSMIYGVYMDSLKDLGYKAERGNLPKEGSNKTDILFGKNAEYDFIDIHKLNSPHFRPREDKNGNMPRPNVNPLTDKLKLTINISEDSTTKSKPVSLNCIGTLAEDFGKNPCPSDCIFMDVNYAKELKSKYDKLNHIKTDLKMQNSYENAIVKASSVNDVPAVEQMINDLGFETYSMENMRKPLEEQMRTIQMILGGLGAISLFVAALGITNTMIMSIYERTREIGIMKVLGCVVRNIRSMFLIEAGAIGFLGGIVGIAQSYGISFIINMMYAAKNANGGQFAGESGVASISIIPIWLALGALLFSTMIGLISGFYPANRAVKIRALTAIKQE